MKNDRQYIIIFICFLLFCVFSYLYFPRVFPIVTIHLTSSRSDVLQKAQVVSGQLQWWNPRFRQSASFGVDSEFKDYVELKAGGAQSFLSVLKSKQYYPYTWTVRQFQVGSQTENYFYFTPDGQLYGFAREIPDTDPGPRLSKAQALKIAQKKAIQYHISLADYQLIEHSAKEQVSHRVDHTFVYEQLRMRLGESRIRLQLTVSGDQITQLHHFSKIPEAFTREYQAMRSDNHLIASISEMGMVVFYIVGGCIVGGIWLLRRYVIQFKRALMWAALISGAQLLCNINTWPLLWMNYDTALSQSSFIVRTVLGFALSFLSWAGIFTVILVVAEGFTRKAFPKRFQFFRLWHSVPAGSSSMFFQTVVGYGVASLNLAYVIAFYFVTTHFLHWWTPAETVIDPDMMATIFPSINPIANAFQAGFVEECLFRAIPLGGAILIGQKWGRKYFWIALAFILQILIFSAAHANYQSFPAYSRMIELIVPSTIFGILYLTFGLYPGIIAHFVYDTVLMALPIFFASGISASIHKLVILGALLMPITIVVYFRFRKPRSHVSQYEEYQNAALDLPRTSKFVPKRICDMRLIPYWAMAGVLVAGVIGFCFWIGTLSQITPDFSINHMSRAKILSQFKTVQPWHVICTANMELTPELQFAWQTQSPTVFKQLVEKKYLLPPYWNVRFAMFTGDIAKRAETYHFKVDANGIVLEWMHQLPEIQKSDSLAQEQAVALAQDALGIVDQPIAVMAVARPNRTDWIVTFRDSTIALKAGGEARIDGIISGNTITHIDRYLYVPEKWVRAYAERQSVLRIVQLVAYAWIGGIFLLGLIIVIQNPWTLDIKIRNIIVLFLLFSAVFTIKLINSIPQIMGGMSTAQPLFNQWAMVVGGALVFQLMLALILAILTAFYLKWAGFERGFLVQQSRWYWGLMGVGSIALAWVGIALMSVRAILLHPYSPIVSSIDSLNGISLGLGRLLQMGIQFVYISLFFLILVSFSNWISTLQFLQKRNIRWVLITILWVVTGLLISGYFPILTLKTWLIVGGLFSGALLLAYWLFWRYSIYGIFLTVAVFLGVMQFWGG